MAKKKEKEYVVVHDFKDLKDEKQTIYREGDIYTGDSSETRLAELTTTNNAIKKVLIAESIDEEEVKRLAAEKAKAEAEAEKEAARKLAEEQSGQAENEVE